MVALRQQLTFRHIRNKHDFFSSRAIRQVEHRSRVVGLGFDSGKVQRWEPSHEMATTLFIFGGLPGTGKTTLALELARRVSGIYLRIDSIEQAIRDSGGSGGTQNGVRSGSPARASRVRWMNRVISRNTNFVGHLFRTPSHQEHMPRPTLLVAEPEPREALSIRKLVLETAKFNVLTAHSTREALDIFQMFPNISAAVLVGENFVDCSTVADHIKGTVDHKVPVLFLTPRIGATCDNADYNIDSHQPEKLLETVRSILGDPRAIDTPPPNN